MRRKRHQGWFQHKTVHGDRTEAGLVYACLRIAIQVATIEQPVPYAPQPFLHPAQMARAVGRNMFKKDIPTAGS